MKTCLVTGSSRGIGLHLVSTLIGRSHKVIAVTRQASPELKNIKGPGELVILEADVSTQAGVSKVAGYLGHQPLDILINNAGVLKGKSESFNQLSYKEVQESLDVNLGIAMQVTQSLLESLLKSATPLVAHISSRMGSVADNTSGGYYSYRISKAALNMFNKSFSVDFPKVTSLVLHPGWVKTEMGGPGATLTPIESAQGLVRVIERAEIKDTGKFFNYNGETLPW